MFRPAKEGNGVFDCWDVFKPEDLPTSSWICTVFTWWKVLFQKYLCMIYSELHPWHAVFEKHKVFCYVRKKVIVVQSASAKQRTEFYSQVIVIISGRYHYLLFPVKLWIPLILVFSQGAQNYTLLFSRVTDRLPFLWLFAAKLYFER